MLEIYNFFVYFFVCGVIVSVLIFGAGQLNGGAGTKDIDKFSAYECGFDPFEHTRFGFDVRFYLVAIFYIIFDLEVIFFFPLSISASYLTTEQFFTSFVFIFFLFLGLIYEFWFGKIDWSL
jgi:NADH:ubiquinone oxidoreductase subunit 3 (subunit A)